MVGGQSEAAKWKRPHERLRSCFVALTPPLCYRGRAITAADVRFICELIAAHPADSRRALSHRDDRVAEDAFIERAGGGVSSSGEDVRSTRNCKGQGLIALRDLVIRTVYYRPTRKPPQIRERFAVPIKQLIEEHPSSA